MKLSLWIIIILMLFGLLVGTNSKNHKYKIIGILLCVLSFITIILVSFYSNNTLGIVVSSNVVNSKPIDKIDIEKIQIGFKSVYIQDLKEIKINNEQYKNEVVTLKEIQKVDCKFFYINIPKFVKIAYVDKNIFEILNNERNNNGIIFEK